MVRGLLCVHTSDEAVLINAFVKANAEERVPATHTAFGPIPPDTASISSSMSLVKPPMSEVTDDDHFVPFGYLASTVEQSHGDIQFGAWRRGRK